MPGIWVELQNFLDGPGASLIQHSSRRVILTLPHGSYDESEEREATVEMTNLELFYVHRVQAVLRNSAVQTPSFTTETPVTSST